MAGPAQSVGARGVAAGRTALFIGFAVPLDDAQRDDVEKQRVEHKSRTADELLSSLNSVVLQAQEKAITDDLAARKIEDAEDRERVLVRFLASNQLAYVFEVINAKIFGSQLALLQRANAEEQGIEREDVEPFYQSSIGGHFDDDPEAGIRSYIHFLLEHRLLVQELEKYKITYLGRDFLTYIIHHGHSGAGFM